MSSLLEQWDKKPGFRLCDMYHVEHAIFGSSSRYQAMGTGGLGLCTVLIVTYPGGAVMAHIPLELNPKDVRPNRPQTSEELCRQMTRGLVSKLEDAEALRYEHRLRTHIIMCADNKTLFTPAIPEHEDIIRDVLQRKNIPASAPSFYRYDFERVVTVPAAGTVMILGRDGHERPEVYLEDSRLS